MWKCFLFWHKDLIYALIRVFVWRTQSELSTTKILKSWDFRVAFFWEGGGWGDVRVGCKGSPTPPLLHLLLRKFDWQTETQVFPARQHVTTCVPFASLPVHDWLTTYKQVFPSRQKQTETATRHSVSVRQEYFFYSWCFDWIIVKLQAITFTLHKVLKDSACVTKNPKKADLSH